MESDPEQSDFSYDQGRVERPGPGELHVWVKVAYAPAGKASAREILKDPKYAELAATLYAYDIDCKGRRSRLDRVIHLDGKGGEIAEFNLTGKTDWEEIPRGAELEDVMERECK